jgi:RimJ/RimL family protein N-acetyltransferase
MNITPVTLDGEHVRLVPLTAEHIDPLWEAGDHAELWRWTWAAVASRDDMRRYVDEALALAAAGRSLPFVTTDAATGRVIGSTRFANAEPAHRRVEIGWTWITPAWQRTRANTEAKLLMLRHAFEDWGCRRVELKTDALNDRSRNAMLRIGPQAEGLYRNHGNTDSGRSRDTAWFSIIDDEWPAVRERLQGLLGRPWQVPTP